MRVLLDHCVPRRLARHLPGHEVRTASQMGWEELRNGRLLQAAADSGFDAVITVDANIRAQQNLDRLPVAVVVLRVVRNAPSHVLPLAPRVLEVLRTIERRTLIEVDARRPYLGSGEAIP